MKMFLRTQGLVGHALRLAGLGIGVLAAAAAVYAEPRLDREELTARLIPVTGEPQRSVDLAVPFARNSAELTAGAREQMAELGAALAGERLKPLDVGVHGHTDASGAAAYNQKLSEKRAAAVVQYLVQRFSLEPKRFRHAGYGEERLLEGIDANSPRHRRVEIVVFAAARPVTAESQRSPDSGSASPPQLAVAPAPAPKAAAPPESAPAPRPAAAPEPAAPPEPASASKGVAAPEPAAPPESANPPAPSAASTGAQAVVDEYEVLSAQVGQEQTVPVLVTGWHPVTGEESSGEGGTAGGGPVAVTGEEFVKAVKGRGGVSEVRRYEHLPFIAMRVDATALAAAKAYDAGVRIWRDEAVEPFLGKSGPMVGAYKAHQGGYTGKGTFIAVVDTGTDVKHPFIAGRPIIEACFAKRCPNGETRMVGPGAARPLSFHGTHVAGIALGRGAKMSGVAPEAGLIAINVFHSVKGRSRGRTSSTLAALDWLIGVARSGRAPIASVNLSLGSRPRGTGVCQHPGYEQAAWVLASENVAVVAAAGNNGQFLGISRPACISGIVSVGAIDKDGRVARFSNSAPVLDMLAPGVGILSAVPPSGGKGKLFKEVNGTSMAAPHVAGAYAVLRQASPQASLKMLFRALTRGGEETRDRRNYVRTPALNLAGALDVLGVRPAGSDSRPAGIEVRESAPGSGKGVWQPIGQ